jgi:hypothetical protein
MNYEVEVVEHFATVLKKLCDQRAKDINAALKNPNNFYTPVQTERNINACGALLEMKTLIEKALVEFKASLPAKPHDAANKCACTKPAVEITEVPNLGRSGNRRIIRRRGAAVEQKPAQQTPSTTPPPTSPYASAAPTLAEIPTLGN